MLDIKAYQALSLEDKEREFSNFLSLVKTPTAADSYPLYLQLRCVDNIVSQISGKTYMLDVVDCAEIDAIYNEIKRQPFNESLKRFPATSVKAYLTFVESMLNGSMPSGVAKHSSAVSIPVNPNYVNSSQFINSTEPTLLEKELLELVVNHRLTLNTTTLSFADIIDQLEVEFSPIRKTKVETISKASLQAHLLDCKKELNSLRKELDQLDEQIRAVILDSQSRGESLCDNPEFWKLHSQQEPLLGSEYALSQYVQDLESKIQSSNAGIEVKTRISGEFIPSSTSPKVVLYYNNMDSCGIADRWKILIGVFIHEMFHAWNYFRADKNPRSVLVVDEPMVEFGTLYFLRNLTETLDAQNHSRAGHLRAIWEKRVDIVEKKKKIEGDTGAYGFGHFLYENANAYAVRLIEEYSTISASLSTDDSSIKKIQKNLIPFYSFKKEQEVLKLFKKVIL
jgi:hypothetical protein